MKIRKCPKCRGKIAYYKEFWKDSVIEFSADDNGGVLLNENGHHVDGILNTGDPHCVIAYCGECGHEWQLRGITQIIELYDTGY